MIYLDNNATTRIDPHVLDEMQLILNQGIGNPSSLHAAGREGRNLLLTKRKEIASFFGADEKEIFFVSGATEGLNLLIQGFQSKKKHVITSSLEHIATLNALAKLEERGWRVTYLNPEKGKGAIISHQVEEVISEETALIVLMAANNETGIKTEIDSIASLAEARGISFLVDGVSLLGKEGFTLPRGVSACCFSGHKIHAPLGIGVVIARPSYRFEPLIVGGHQERGKRGGTENLVGIGAFAKALERITKELPEAEKRMEGLRNRFEAGLKALFPEIKIHGEDQKRICNTSNIAFPHLDGESLLIRLDLAGICASHGSACRSGGMEPSHVLLNMGISAQEARSSLRFSLSRFTTEEEIETVLNWFRSLKRPLL